MWLKIFIWVCFVCGTLATSNHTDKNQNLDDNLKNCLSTVVEKLCPNCITVHLVIPSKPSWKADALVSHFSDSSNMNAVTIYCIDRSGYEDPFLDQVGLYLVITPTDLERALTHLTREKSGRNYVVWVKFLFGLSLRSYVRYMIPATWNLGNARGVIFIALIEGEIQVFGTPIQESESLSAQIFRNLSVCDTKALIEAPQSYKQVIEIQKPILNVVIRPALRPYLVARKTDNPGGFIETLTNVLKEKLNFTPKYALSYDSSDMPKSSEKDDVYLVFDFRAHPKPAFSSIPVLPGSPGLWVVAMRNQFDRRNILALPFKTNFLLHITLLAVHTSVMVYLSRDFDRTRIMLRLFGMFFGIGIGWLPRKPLFRFLIALWCFTSYVLAQAYLAALTSDFSHPIAEFHFRDTEDLMESGITIWCNNEIRDLYCHLKSESHVYICEKCVITDVNQFLQLDLDELRMNKTWRPFAFHTNRKVFISTLAGGPFIKMSEQIVTWPGIIDSNADAQFLETVAIIYRNLAEAGITQYWFNQYEIKNITDDKYEPAKLSMSDLNYIFIILYVGWSCSIITFIVEIITKFQN